MHAHLAQRRKALQGAWEAGEHMLADLDARRATLRVTLLRISGAIQVLDEALHSAAVPPAP